MSISAASGATAWGADALTATCSRLISTGGWLAGDSAAGVMSIGALVTGSGSAAISAASNENSCTEGAASGSISTGSSATASGGAAGLVSTGNGGHVVLAAAGVGGGATGMAA